jgi:hypothetical protein
MDLYTFYGCHMCGRVIKINRFDTFMPNLDCQCGQNYGLGVRKLFSDGEFERQDIRILNREKANGDRPI